MPHATILYAEDDKIVAEAVTELLEDVGWSVDACSDGNSAKNRIACGFDYELLLLDNDLPGVSGLELARYARSLQPYRYTPIIMLSATDCSADARRAGADLFLRKPEDVARLVEVVRRLLARAR
jgi:two-component system chemotaxis response regulator CheY